MNEPNDSTSASNAYKSPQAEDEIRPLVADNPRAYERVSIVGLYLWAGWLMLVLVVIVWLVG